VTGQAGERVVAPLVARLNAIENLEVNLMTLKSAFWGPMISVTGLLTYQDLVEGLAGEDLGDEVIISKIMLKDDTDLTLDGKHVPELSAALGVPVAAVENSARGLAAGALGTGEHALRGGERAYHGPYEPNLPLAALN
jgi:NifB/MoaA-like Fe-S oxidoreductase